MNPLSRHSTLSVMAVLALFTATGSAATLAMAPPAAALSAVTLYVSTTGTNTSSCDDPADSCPTLQDALNVAEGSAFSGDDVTIDVGPGTYTENDTISASALDSLTIDGSGSSETIVTGGDTVTSTPVLSVDSGTVSIDDLSVNGPSGSTTSTDGSGVVNNGGTVSLSGDTFANDTATDGGAVDNNAGTVTLTNDVLSNDSAVEGGGVYNSGAAASAVLTGDTLEGDSALQGGGIYSQGSDGSPASVMLSNTVLNDDAATIGAVSGTALGGGIFNSIYSNVTANDDTFSGDTASGPNASGGGLYNSSGATLASDTFSDDSAGTDGGGIFNSNGTLNLTNDTLFDDTSNDGGALLNDTGSANIVDSTLADDAAAFEGNGTYNVPGGELGIANSILDSAGCFGSIGDGGYNVESDDTCGFGATDVVNSSTIDLAPALASNGSNGPQTLAIDATSSAFEEVPELNCTVGTDERGDTRPGFPQAACDAGAFELQGASAPPPSTITVDVSGSQTYGGTPVFTYTDEAPSGVSVSGTPECSTLSDPTPIAPGLPAGTYTIDGTSCSGLSVSDPTSYTLTYSGVSGGFVVSRDSTTIALSTSPVSSQPYGSEQDTSFVVSVSTGNGEVVPTGETVTVDVGTTSCVVTLSGGSGSCAISADALLAGTYNASASYAGDTDLDSSGPATTPFDVTLTMSPTTLPNAVLGVAYPVTDFSAGGAHGTVTFGVTSGSLPLGLTLSTAGVLSGTADSAGEVGETFGFSVTATDADGNTVTQAYSISVTSQCGAGFTAELLKANAFFGESFTGLFCVNRYGVGTYTQGSLHGTGTIRTFFGITVVEASGTGLNLFGLGFGSGGFYVESRPSFSVGEFALTSGE